MDPRTSSAVIVNDSLKIFSLEDLSLDPFRSFKVEACLGECFSISDSAADSDESKLETEELSLRQKFGRATRGARHALH
jgi:hypothetical protein